MNEIRPLELPLQSLSLIVVFWHDRLVEVL